MKLYNELKQTEEQASKKQSRFSSLKALDFSKFQKVQRGDDGIPEDEFHQKSLEEISGWMEGVGLGDEDEEEEEDDDDDDDDFGDHDYMLGGYNGANQPQIGPDEDDYSSDSDSDDYSD